MIERLSLLKHKKFASTALIGGVLLTGCGAKNDGLTIGQVRAVAAQEALYYNESNNIASTYEAALKVGKTASISYLPGKIVDGPAVAGTAKEYGTITDPILLTEGPDFKGSFTQADDVLDGGFIGVQSTYANGQIQIDVVPFNKNTMQFKATNTNQILYAKLATVQVQNLHGSLQGTFAVDASTTSGPVTIPGFAPNQAH